MIRDYICQTQQFCSINCVWHYILNVKKRYLIFGIIFLVLMSGCINQPELPDVNKIENFSSSKFSASTFPIPVIEEGNSYFFNGVNMTETSLKDEDFKKIVKTAKIIDNNEYRLQNWHYVPWHSGFFNVQDKHYSFDLYLGGLGRISEVKPQEKISNPDNVNTFQATKEEGVFFYYSVDFALGKNRNRSEKNISIALYTNGKIYAKENIKLGVRFNNIGGGQEVKILDAFSPTPVFFSFYIEREDGTPINVPKAGKIDLVEDSLKCLTLDGPGDQYYADINLSDILPEGLEEGLYYIAVEYHNQYGDCFKGTLTSEPIALKVVEKTAEEIAFEKKYKKYIDDRSYCEKDTDCYCMMGSGMPFVGCGNFLLSGPGGSYGCSRCKCIEGTCQ